MAAGAAKLAWENSRAQNGSLLVVMALAFEVEAGGNCIMTVAELAGKARLSERAVQSATADLARLGELTVTPRAEGHRNGYSLSLLRGAESAPLPAGSPADSAPPQILHPAESAPLPPEEPQVKARGADSAPLEIPDALNTGTGRSGVEVRKESGTRRKTPAAPRPDVDRLCEHLADRIEANGSKRPNTGKRWKDAARLLLDADGRTEEQVHACIDWCQQDSFWHRHILSMEKLREKYDRLRLDAKAGQQRKAPAQKSTTNDRVQQAIEAGKRVQAMLNGESP